MFSQPCPYLLYNFPFFSYSLGMFVSVAIDPGSEGRENELADLLGQYGFKKMQRFLWESMAVSTDTLNRLKRDLDKATDGFDKLRFFQFPMEGTLVLSSLRDKKWRRLVAVGESNEKNVSASAHAPVTRTNIRPKTGGRT
jgi:CRISPR-associated protein Cas2